MKPSVPTIAPILRSDVQGAVLAELLLGGRTEYTVTELRDAAEATAPTVHREVNRLVESGFATERRSGRNRYIAANVGHPLYRPVKEIIEYAYGPRAVITQALRGVEGVVAAYIYGSWAARLGGEPGMDPQDIDVLLIGDVDRAAAIDVSDEATAKLDRDVNIRTITKARWDAQTEPFLQNIRTRPLIPLSLGEP